MPETPIILTQKQLDEVAKTAAALSRESHQESLSRLVNDLKNQDKLIIEKLTAIHEETKKTNGRVTKLENAANEHRVDVAVMKDHVEQNRRILNSTIAAIGMMVLTALVGTVLI